MNKIILLSGVWFSILLFITGCQDRETTRLYYPFPDDSWQRFNILHFEIPIPPSVNTADLYLDIYFTHNFEPESFNFNAIVNTSGGEERINEFLIKVKGVTGKWILDCKEDSCTGTSLLQKDLRLGGNEKLTLDIENLNPRIETAGISGVAVRLVPSGN